MADAFTVNKSAILFAIDDQVKAGSFAAALAASNKYDNADPDLISLKLRLKASLAEITLQNEKGLTFEQRAAAYSQLAESEPADKLYKDKATALNAQLVAERNAAADKAVKHTQLLARFSA